MITLAKKIKEEREKKEKGNNATESPKSTRISVRDKLLTKGKLPVCFVCTQLIDCTNICFACVNVNVVFWILFEYFNLI